MPGSAGGRRGRVRAIAGGSCLSTPLRSLVPRREWAARAEGLYVVGGGTHPGAGVPGVLMSAETTCGCIAADFGLPDQWGWDEPGRVDLDEALAAASPALAEVVGG